MSRLGLPRPLKLREPLALGAPLGGVGAAYGAPFQAPQGYRWEFVLDDATNQRVIDDATNQPLIDLVPA